MIYNFRDMGGWPIPGGKRVKKGLVFRSGALCFADEKDVARLKALGVEHILDLRAIEQSEESKDVICPDVNYYLLPPKSGTATPGYGLICDIKFNRCKDPKKSMLAGYAAMTSTMERAFAGALRVIAHAKAPLLFHCQVGKDRTGGLAALLLTVLGVEREQVLEDYMLTNAQLEEKNRQDMEVMKKALNASQMELVSQVYDAKPEYIGSFLAEAERRWGGVEEYVRECLGITRAELELLRSRLTE